MKYRLLKDLPGVKAGTIRDEEDFMYDVEIHEEWFEPIPDTPKKPKTVWDLKEGDERWDILRGQIHCYCWYDETKEKIMRDTGDIFLTKEDAERELAYRKAKSCILKHHAENSGFVPCWTDGLEKFSIYYVHPHGTVEKGVIGICPSEWHQEQVLCYFASREEAQQSIKDCEREWRVIFDVTL